MAKQRERLLTKSEWDKIHTLEVAKAKRLIKVPDPEGGGLLLAHAILQSMEFMLEDGDFERTVDFIKDDFRAAVAFLEALPDSTELMKLDLSAGLDEPQLTEWKRIRCDIEREKSFEEVAAP